MRGNNGRQLDGVARKARLLAAFAKRSAFPLRQAYAWATTVQCCVSLESYLLA